MNTRINYLYRDRDNYKVHGMETIRGEITEKQIERICESLHGGEYFLPAMVGLPALSFGDYIPEVDHPWCELGAMSFDLTEHKPTVQMSTEELVEKFTRAAQTGWSESKLPDAQAPHNGEHQPFEVVTSYSFDETIERKRFPTYTASKQWAISDILRELSIDLLESEHTVDFHFNGDEGQIIVTGKVNDEGETTLLVEPSITTWAIAAERNG